jgi:hypothetical protein
MTRAVQSMFHQPYLLGWNLYKTLVTSRMVTILWMLWEPRIELFLIPCLRECELGLPVSFIGVAIRFPTELKMKSYRMPPILVRIRWTLIFGV